MSLQSFRLTAAPLSGFLAGLIAIILVLGTTLPAQAQAPARGGDIALTGQSALGSGPEKPRWSRSKVQVADERCAYLAGYHWSPARGRCIPDPTPGQGALESDPPDITPTEAAPQLEGLPSRGYATALGGGALQSGNPEGLIANQDSALIQRNDAANTAILQRMQAGSTNPTACAAPTVWNADAGQCILPAQATEPVPGIDISLGQTPMPLPVPRLSTGAPTEAAPQMAGPRQTARGYAVEHAGGALQAGNPEGLTANQDSALIQRNDAANTAILQRMQAGSTDPTACAAPTVWNADAGQCILPAQAQDPVPGVDIRLGQNPGALRQRGQSDAEGLVRFRRLPPGNYRIDLAQWPDLSYPIVLTVHVQGISGATTSDSVPPYGSEEAQMVRNSSKGFIVAKGGGAFEISIPAGEPRNIAIVVRVADSRPISD